MNKKMNLVEQFNHDVNNSDQTRFERWTDYRKKVSAFLLPHFEEHGKQEKLLILGAGNCDDLDLLFLKTHYSFITLTDIDVLNIQKGIINQGLSVQDFEILQVDYTGFEKVGFFNHLVDDLLLCTSVDAIESLIISKLKNLTNHQFLSSYERMFDSILMTPLYTQLVLNQVLNTMEVMDKLKYPNHLIKFIEARMLDEMPIIIDRFNQNVNILLKENGYLFILSDIFQSGIDEAFYHQVTQSIDSVEFMDLIYANYMNLYGYGLGDYGLLSMSYLRKSKHYTWLIWPFTEQVHMIVKFEIFSSL